jgi:hypothetical protein
VYIIVKIQCLEKEKLWWEWIFGQNYWWDAGEFEVLTAMIMKSPIFWAYKAV